MPASCARRPGFGFLREAAVADRAGVIPDSSNLDETVQVAETAWLRGSSLARAVYVVHFRPTISPRLGD
jgi:hypothetical protein